MITILRLAPGEDEVREFSIENTEIDGYTATAFFEVGSERIDLDTDEGIEVDEEEDVIRVSLTDEQTAALGAAGHFGRAQVWAKNGGTDMRLVRAALVVL